MYAMRPFAFNVKSYIEKGRRRKKNGAKNVGGLQMKNCTK
jgi:hypothetical protein